MSALVHEFRARVLEAYSRSLLLSRDRDAVIFMRDGYQQMIMRGERLMSKSVIMSFISSTIGTAGTTILGKSMVSNLFKLIPGVGTGVGGMISGSTASLLTTALGEAYIKFMEMIYKGELKKEDLYDQNGQKAISKMFKEELTKKRKQSF